ncbi:hypothetical protein C8J57DRAFT_1325645 [Mycena rebaudengoi]|nr:hypothetical protein C8J57DRAFT_1325645 [Mycena rebaudengoi]
MLEQLQWLPQCWLALTTLCGTAPARNSRRDGENMEAWPHEPAAKSTSLRERPFLLRFQTGCRRPGFYEFPAGIVHRPDRACQIRRTECSVTQRSHNLSHGGFFGFTPQNHGLIA